jgi:hypothetical protein
MTKNTAIALTEDEDKDAIAITGLNLPDWLR